MALVATLQDIPREDRPLTQAEFVDFWTVLTRRLLEHSMNTQATVAGLCMYDALKETFGKEA